VNGNVHTGRDAGTGAFGSTIHGNYTCDGCYFEDLYGVTVHGNMHVRSAELGDFVCESWIGGSLMIRDSRTIDAESGEIVYTFEIAFSEVVGNVALVNNHGPILISQNDLHGNVTLDRNNVGFAANYPAEEGCGISQTYDGGEVSSNTIGGSLLVTRSAGDVDISSNTIAGRLACTNNAPAPGGGGNTAASKRGQCASL
jgi:hypothetical protein